MTDRKSKTNATEAGSTIQDYLVFKREAITNLCVLVLNFSYREKFDLLYFSNFKYQWAIQQFIM